MHINYVFMLILVRKSPIKNFANFVLMLLYLPNIISANYTIYVNIHDFFNSINNSHNFCVSLIYYTYVCMFYYFIVIIAL